MSGAFGHSWLEGNKWQAYSIPLRSQSQGGSRPRTWEASGKAGMEAFSSRGTHQLSGDQRTVGVGLPHVGRPEQTP